VVNLIVAQPGVAFAGLGVMAAGIPVYWWMRRKAQAAGSPRRARSAQS
jgi:hypothetical protein